MAVFRRGKVWWYEFLFAGRRVRESAKTPSKTVVTRRKNATANWRGASTGWKTPAMNASRSLKELAEAYLEEYKLRHRSVTFAKYAVGNVTRHLGELMAVDVTDKTVKNYPDDAAQREGGTENH